MTLGIRNWYLATCPSNLVAIVKTGKPPDDQKAKVLKLFQTFQEALKDCPEISSRTPPCPSQAFILKLAIPDVEHSELIQKVNDIQQRREFLKAKQFKTEWIISAHLYLKKSKNIFFNLLNSEFDKPMLIEPDEFKQFDIKYQKKSSVEIEEEKEEHFSSPPQYLKPLSGERPHQITEKQGDLLGSRMQTLVNTVNCVGIMGKGIALAFKQKYPEMFLEYQKRCKQKNVSVGVPYLYIINSSRKIINFPTKNHWKNNSQLEWIEHGLDYLAKHIKEWSITSLAIPPLGCGNGGLDWDKVKPLVYKYLQPLGIEIEIYVPFLSSKKTSSGSRKRKKPQLDPND